MTTAATSLLGLALPVEGELSGTWGDTVNASITSLLDSAIAGTTTISIDADITLSTTTLATNEARQATILWTASGTTTRYITAPAQSKTYVIINKTGGTQDIVIRGAGPTTGVTVAAGVAIAVAWDGTDFVSLASISTIDLATQVSGVLAVANGGTGTTTSTGTGDVVLSDNPRFNTNINTGNTPFGFGAYDGFNVAAGQNSLGSNSSGTDLVAVGTGALANETSGAGIVALGGYSLSLSTSVSYSVALGAFSQYASTTISNTSAGHASMFFGSGGTSTAIGYQAAGTGTTAAYSNFTCLGANTEVTGNNQVQLGDSATTTYVYGTVQNRSDLRDKADVRDTVLGLNFITKLRPVDYKWDLRDSYRAAQPEMLELLPVPAGATDAESARIEAQNAAVRAQYAAAMEDWGRQNTLSNLQADGTNTRSRYHHGLIAQEVQAVIAETGVDFGGFQNHALKGGDDVMTIGYDELIAPLIKAVQELKAEFDAYKAAHP